MKLPILFFALIAVVLLSGCDPAKGPVIISNYSRDLRIVASFSDGKQISGVSFAGKVWWLGYGKFDLVELKVIDSESLLYDLKGVELRNLTSAPRDGLVILQIDKTEVKSVTRDVLNHHQ